MLRAQFANLPDFFWVTDDDGNILHRAWASYYGGDIRADDEQSAGSGKKLDSKPHHAELTRAVHEGQQRKLLLESRVAEAEARLLRSQLSAVQLSLPNHGNFASAPYNCYCSPTDPRCQPTGSVYRLELPPWNGDQGSVGVPPLAWSVEPLRGGICPSIKDIQPLPTTCSSIKSVKP